MNSASFQTQITALLFADNAAFAGGRGVFRSSDGGRTWEDVTGGLGTLPASESARPRFGVVAFAYSDPELLVALNGNVPETGLWARDDATGNWTRVELPRDGFVTGVAARPQVTAVGFSNTTGTGAVAYIRRLTGGSWDVAGSQQEPPSVSGLTFLGGGLFAASYPRLGAQQRRVGQAPGDIVTRPRVECRGHRASCCGG